MKTAIVLVAVVLAVTAAATAQPAPAWYLFTGLDGPGGVPSLYVLGPFADEATCARWRLVRTGVSLNLQVPGGTVIPYRFTTRECRSVIMP